MKKMAKGEITAFLSLIFLLLLSLVGAVLESASIQVLKNERRADASRAIESVFAEYQQELFEEYKIFAIEGSYETGTYSESNILNRLVYYGAENMEAEVSEIQYLTDQGGQAFYEQAAQYEKEKTGLDQMEELIGNVFDWNIHLGKYKTYEEDQRETSKRLDQIFSENEVSLPKENNPLESISLLQSKGLLSVFLPEEFEISKGMISGTDAVSKRQLQSGNWSENDSSDEPIFFNLYLREHFGNALEKKEDSVLEYELEYLLAGKDSDRENLEEVLKDICNLRFGINYLYLLSDSAKQAEARTMAASLCSLLTVPGVTEVVTQAILLAWAYGESVVDVRTLMSGGKIAILKTSGNWKVSLKSLTNLGNGSGISTTDDKGGIDYKIYLQVMLYARNRQVLCERALDLIEQNLKHSYSFFKADNCITGLKVQMDCILRRGAGYNFVTQYHYQ